MNAKIRQARTCYSHLAGVLGVALTEALVEQGILQVNTEQSTCHLTERGRERLQQFGLDVDGLKKGRRAFARLCLDGSEKRYHLAGALGDALAARLFEMGYIERFDSSRAVRLTAAGQSALEREFGVFL